MHACVRLLPILALAAAPDVSRAHQAPAGWTYDGWCCGGRDCQPITQEMVTITPNGYLVSIPEGSHMTARHAVQKLFGYGEVRRSGDQRYHACILPGTQEFRCLYVPDFTY